MSGQRLAWDDRPARLLDLCDRAHAARRGRPAGHRRATGVTPSQGLWEGHAHPTLFCSYVVDDAVAAVARVRAAGGTSTEPHREPYGLIADCSDDQGTRFSITQFPG